MNTKVYAATGIAAAALSMITAFFDWRISLGILLAGSASLVNLYLLSLSMKGLMDKDNVAGYPVMMGLGIFRFMLLAGVIFLAVKNPQLFNIYGVTAGLILFMIGLLYDALTRKEG